MITTKNIKLTSNTLFKILMKIYFRLSRWVIFFMIFLALIYLSMNNKGLFEYLFIFFPILYSIALIFICLVYSFSKDNRIFLIERYYEITEDMMIAKMANGTESQIKIESFIKLQQTKKYYLLYLSKISFIYIPKISFQNEMDKLWFENNIIAKFN